MSFIYTEILKKMTTTSKASQKALLSFQEFRHDINEVHINMNGFARHIVPALKVPLGIPSAIPKVESRLGA